MTTTMKITSAVLLGSVVSMVSGGCDGRTVVGDSAGAGGAANIGGTGGTVVVNGAGGTAGAVESDAGPNHYTDNDDGTITDNATGLMWETASATLASDGGIQPVILAWSAAISYCATTVNAKALGGYHDWRLPALDELSSIIDPGSVPTIDGTYFTGTWPATYWSSSAGPAGSPPVAWAVNFDTGGATTEDASNGSYIRCVR